MPAESKKQQMMMAIAEHTPGELYKRNRGVLSMSKGQLHEFATTKRKGLPTAIGEEVKKRAKKKIT